MELQFREAEFLKNFKAKNPIDGFVIGISGGIDSTVCLALACEAVGPENVFAMLMPWGNQEYSSSYEDSVKICKHFGVQSRTVNIQKIVDSFNEEDEYHCGNIMARVRMTLLYNEAAKRKYAVINTCNLSEDLTGYATKFGDTAGDIAPIAHCVKEQVYRLAEYLGIPECLINRIPSAGLWENQTDEQELGFTYVELDKVIERFLLHRCNDLMNGVKTYNVYEMYKWMDSYKDEHELPISKESWDLIYKRNKAAQHKFATIPSMMYLLNEPL